MLYVSGKPIEPLFMCKMMFIGTFKRLTEVPWNETNPTFCLQQPEGEEKAVLDKFTNPNVYFVGTKRGCSCDFIRYSNTDNEDYEVERNALRKIIDEQIADGNNVEIYCCWAGNYASSVEEVSTKVYPANLNKFYIDENELITYTRH